MVAHSSGETFEGLRRRRGPSGGRGGPLRRRRLSPSSRAAADRPRIVAAGDPHADPPDPLPADRRAERLAAARVHRQRAAAKSDPPRRSQRLGPAPRPLDRRLRLRHRPARGVRTRGLAAGAAGRRRRRLLRDPRLLSPGRDRRAPLRRRRHVLDLEPRHPPRRAPRPGRLPEPDLDPASTAAARPARMGRR